MQENNGLTHIERFKFIYQIFDEPAIYDEEIKEYVYASEKTSKIFNELKKSFSFDLTEKIDETQIPR
jgi:hypothetical protein